MKTILAIIGAGTVAYFAAQLNEAYVQYRIQEKTEELERRWAREQAKSASAEAV